MLNMDYGMERKSIEVVAVILGNKTLSGVLVYSNIKNVKNINIIENLHERRLYTNIIISKDYRTMDG